MPESEHSALVDTALIEQALADHKKHASRVPETAADLQAAQAVADVARLAAQAAAAGNGDDPLAAEVAHEDAARRARVAGHVHEAALVNAATALAAITAARGRAWRPVYLEGVRRRIAACRAGEVAKAALAKAEADSDAAWAVMNEAAANGVATVEYMHNAQPWLRTEAEERHLWKANGLDPDAGKFDGWV